MRDLRWSWVWVALYAVAGALCLAILAMSMQSHASELTLPAYGEASLVGCALLAFFTDGQSLREGVLAAILIGVTQLMFKVVAVFAHIEILSFETTLASPLSTSLLCLTGAVLGGKAGAFLARSAGRKLRIAARVLFAAMLLVGAVYVHAVVISFAGRLSGGLAIALTLIALATTPSLAAAALQLTHAAAAEGYVAAGIALLGVFLEINLVLMGHGLGVLSLCAVVFVFAGVTIYGIALPGVLTLRQMAIWPVAAVPLPTALALEGEAA